GVTGVALVGYREPQLLLQVFDGTAAEDETLESSSGSDAAAPPDVDPFSLTQADSVLVVQGDDFFTPEAAEALRAVVEELESLDHVRRVVWMDRVPILNIFGLPEPLFPRSSSSPARFAAARDKALKHPLVGGQLLSADAKTLLLL